MARRNDNILATTINAMTEAVRKLHNRNAGNAGQDALERFLRHNPSTFNGSHDHDKAHLWIRELEKLFEALQSPDNQRVGKCEINEDKVKQTQPKNVGPQRNDKKGFPDKEKPYSRPPNYSNQTGRSHNSKSSSERVPKNGNRSQLKCWKCGKEGHRITDCKDKTITCFRCGKPGHISTGHNEVKREQADSSNPQANHLKTKGGIHTLTRAGAAQQENLIQGK